MSLRRDLAAILVLLALCAAVGPFANDYWTGLGISLCMAVALAESWAILSALSGYVSLGHVVFYGLGSYVVVISWTVLPLAVSLPLAAVAAAAFAFVIGLPVLRVRGPYFVILTFGVAELVKFGLVAIESALGHASRLILGAPDPIILYYMMLALAALATVLAFLVRVTRLGHGLRAIRENEEAAETIGVPIAAYKLAAFVLSAAIPGAVGGVMALRATYFEPRIVFDPMISFSMIAMTIIGGSDDLRGPVIGAVLLTTLSELLWANAPQVYMIILGALLVGFVRFLPEGISGLLARGTRRYARAA
jgi:branched-chain amino acid transport system permease protein